MNLKSFTRKDLLDEQVDMRRSAGVIIGEQCGLLQVDKFKVIIEGHLASNQVDEKAGEDWRPDEEATVPELLFCVSVLTELLVHLSSVH